MVIRIEPELDIFGCARGNVTFKGDFKTINKFDRELKKFHENYGTYKL